MSAANPIVERLAASGRNGGVAAMVSRAWKILTWKHWAWATAIAVLAAIWMPFQSFDTNRYWAHWQALFNIPWYLMIAYVFLMAIALAESSLRDASLPSAWRYISAMTVASVICVGIVGALGEYFPRAPKQVIAGQTVPARKFASSEAKVQWQRHYAVNSVISPIVHAWLAMFIYVHLRRSRRAARALADAEIERSEAQRNLLAAQLVAANAQVDPAFVMTTLETIERAYEDDPARADALLDEFIVFLRDAIPRLRPEDSPATANER